MSWDLMSRDRDEPVALIADEAYLMVDPNVPEALMYLRNIEKRDRKYEGLLVIATQQVLDFTHEKVALYGQALIDMPTYKFIFGTDAKNLEDTVKAFNLSEPEADILSSGQQGNAVCVLGTKRANLVFEIPKHRMELMGKGGGR